MKHREADHYGHRPSIESQLKNTMFDGNAALDQSAPVRRVPVRAHMRVVEGEPLPSGAEQRDEALEKHALIAAKREACEYVRARLVELYQRREVWDPNPGVTADDAMKVLDAWPQRPRVLDEIPGDWRGMIFRGAGWMRTGRVVQSQRAGLKATDLPVWRPV